MDRTCVTPTCVGLGIVRADGDHWSQLELKIAVGLPA